MSSGFFKFLIVGGLGFIIDSGLTLGFIQLGLSPLLARPPAILASMTFTWLANRRHTFNIREAGSINEAARYSAVGIAAALLNYTIYSGLIMATCPTFLAIVISTAVVSVLSYFGYKHFAFGKSLNVNTPSN